MVEKHLVICKNNCWCEFCGKSIHKGEDFLNLWKSAMKGSVRINICQVCLEKIFKEINSDELELVKRSRENEDIKGFNDYFKSKLITEKI